MAILTIDEYIEKGLTNVDETVFSVLEEQVEEEANILSFGWIKKHISELAPSGDDIQRLKNAIAYQIDFLTLQGGRERTLQPSLKSESMGSYSVTYDTASKGNIGVADRWNKTALAFLAPFISMGRGRV